MIYKYSRALILCFLTVFFRFKVIGRENIPVRGGFILSPNHASYLDPPVTGSACPRKVNFMAKEDLFNAPLLKYWIKAVGCIPVRHGTSDRHAIRLAVDLLKQGECVCIYPEGMRVPPGMVKEGEPGVALIAEMAGVPVVPMAILGTQPWRMRLLGVFPWFSKIEARIGKPLYFDFQDSAKSRREFYEQVVDRIMAGIRELKTGVRG